MEMSNDGWSSQSRGGNESTKLRRTDVLPARRRAVRPHGCCCCTASATATICFAFTHRHSHLLTHALSASASSNPPPFSPLIPPSFHHLPPAIHPSLRSGFPISASASVKLIFFFRQRSCCSALTAAERFHVTCVAPLPHVSPHQVICSLRVFVLRSRFPPSLWRKGQSTDRPHSRTQNRSKRCESATWGCQPGRRSASSGRLFVFCRGCCVMGMLTLDRRVGLCHLRRHTHTQKQTESH